MEFLEIIQIRRGWDYQFFPGSSEHCLLVRHFYDLYFFPDADFHCGAQGGLRRPGGRLGLHHLRDDFYRRRPAVLPGHNGAVYCQDLYGVETPPALYYFGNEPRRDYKSKIAAIVVLCCALHYNRGKVMTIDCKRRGDRDERQA